MSINGTACVCRKMSLYEVYGEQTMTIKLFKSTTSHFGHNNKLYIRCYKTFGGYMIGYSWFYKSYKTKSILLKSWR